MSIKNDQTLLTHNLSGNWPHTRKKSKLVYVVHEREHADEYNTENKHLCKAAPLAVNLILKRGLVFQTWLP